MANENNIFGLKNLPKNVVPPAQNVPLGNLLGLNAPAGSSSSSSSAPPPFEAAFFLDNDYTYIFQVRPCEPKIVAHKVAGSDGVPRMLPLNSKPYKAFERRLSPAGKAFAKAIAPLNPRGEMLDEGSGIAEKDIEALGDWISEHEGQKVAVLFDYDRTLTVFEGGNFLGNSFEEMLSMLEREYGVSPEGLTVEGMAEYYVGGIKRLRRLQSMFDALYEIPNVSLYVLTNNPICIQKHLFFTQILSVLTRGRPIQMLCSFVFNSNKKRAIQSDPLLAPLCPVKGGRRKTRKHRHRR